MDDFVGYFNSLEDCEKFDGGRVLYTLNDEDLEMLKKGKYLNFTLNAEYDFSVVLVYGKSFDV